MILVTGAIGRSGKWFIQKLISENFSIPLRFAHRKHHDIQPIANSSLNAEFAMGDLVDLAYVDKITKDVDTVVHFAGIGRSKELVKACLKNNVKWVILIHTTGRFSKYKSARGEYEEVEDWVLQSGMTYTIVRPTMIYGSYEDHNIYKLIGFINFLKIVPLIGGGKNLIQPIHAKDLGEAIFAILTNQQNTAGKCYNLAGKFPMTFKDTLKILADALGKRRLFVNIPYSWALFAVWAYNLVAKKPKIIVEQVMRLQEDKNFDYSDASSDFGYNPVPFEEGVKNEIEEFKKSREKRT